MDTLIFLAVSAIFGSITIVVNVTAIALVGKRGEHEESKLNTPEQFALF